MPSLRRTFSSPSVRSTPYPSLSNAVNAAQVGRGNGHRRSSGSEISSRRVLADIEWWRVADGQHDLDADQESEDRNRDQNQDSPASEGLLVDEFLGGIGSLNIDEGPNHFSTSPFEEVRLFPSDMFQFNLPRTSSRTFSLQMNLQLSQLLLALPPAGDMPTSQRPLLWSRLPRQLRFLSMTFA